MNDSLWTFLFEIANFVALAAVLAWLFFKPVRKALADQQAKVRKLEEDAAQALAEAERGRQEIESQRESLAAELDSMRTNSRETAQREAAQILSEARDRAERERSALRRDALHIERSQMAKIAAAVATATHGTVQRFLRQMDGPDLERALMKAACVELQTFGSETLAPVSVETAVPLDGELRQMIDAALGESAATADFRVAPALGGGLRVSTAHGLIDASLAGLAKFAERSLSAEMDAVMREEADSG